MYVNQNGTPTQGAPGAQDLAAIKAFVAEQQQAGGILHGITDAAQIAGVLNAGGSVANPAPRGHVPVTQVARFQVQNFLADIVTLLQRLIPSGDTALVPGGLKPSELLPIYQTKLSTVSVMDLPAFSAATLAPGIAQAVADGVISQQAAAAMTTVPDPTWPATVPVSAWALVALSVPAYIEAADITAAAAALA